MSEAAAAARPLVLFGTGALAERARYYFEEAGRRIAGFALDAAFRRDETFQGLPVAPFERLPEIFDPAEHDLFAAIGYKDRNLARERVARAARGMGYGLASCVAPSAVLNRAAVGPNSLIMDNVVLGPFTTVGEGFVVAPGAVVSHHGRVGSYVYVGSNATISGYCQLGDRVFVGAGAAIIDHATIATGTFIGIGSVVTKSVARPGVYAGVPARPLLLDEA